ncbi:SDR family NAD(P)-dependent oxidoreductase [Cellulomonas dongxiuzhuiae]|uniref:SDR family NAD(P)-dependent oxidoreductase n=1 Tax=Cellulomonas dongxiuzhuiae TaxID=2819979 RepID=UPI001AAF6F6A|nr:SDR family oxidoreductase [Cellulomonas dongxiuzhuiae]MBO3087132.1 SDR family oxidoreductase [Cellulomonas dongxiuzhuiae]
MSDTSRLDGQVAVVVGAGHGGLGARAAAALAGRGAHVVVTEHERESDSLRATLADLPDGALGLHCDVTRADQVEATMDEVLTRLGRVDVLVSCAGTMLRREFDLTTPDEFEHVLRVNTVGTWLVAGAAGKIMRDHRPDGAAPGRIVTTSTVYAERVGPIPEAAYYASKAGVLNVTRALAQELGPFGIRANCLAPGVFYPTRMTSALEESPERLDWFARRTMLGRNGDPDKDFTGPMLFLATEESSFVTGQVLYVDGGWSAW